MALHAARAPHQFSEHHTLRQSRVLRMPATNSASRILRLLCLKPLDALTFRLHDKRAHIGNRVVSAIVPTPTDAASQESVVGSAQPVVVVRARAPRDATNRTSLLSRVPRLLASIYFELDGSVGCTVRGCTCGMEAAQCVAYAPVDLDGQVGIVVAGIPPCQFRS